MASIYDENEKTNSISNKKPSLRISKKVIDSSKSTASATHVPEKKSKRTISRKAKENNDIENSKSKPAKASKEIKSNKKSKEKSKVQNIVEDMIQMLNSKDFMVENNQENIEDKKVKETEPVLEKNETEINDPLACVFDEENNSDSLDNNEINSLENDTEDTLPSLVEKENEKVDLTDDEPVKINTSVVDESTAVVPNINKILRDTTSVSIFDIENKIKSTEAAEENILKVQEHPQVERATIAGPSLELDKIDEVKETISNEVKVEKAPVNNTIVAPTVSNNETITNESIENNNDSKEVKTHKTALELNQELMEEENKAKKSTVILPNFTITRSNKKNISRRKISLNVKKDYDDLIVTPKPTVSINQNASFFYEPSVFERFNIDISSANDDMNTTSTTSSENNSQEIIEDTQNIINNFENSLNEDSKANESELEKVLPTLSNETQIPEIETIDDIENDNDEEISNVSSNTNEEATIEEKEIETIDNNDLSEISLDDLDLDYIDLADFENDYSEDVIDELDGSSVLKNDTDSYNESNNNGSLINNIEFDNNNDVEDSINNVAADSIQPIQNIEKSKTSIYGAISPVQHSSLSSKHSGIYSNGSNIFKRFSFEESALINENNNINEILNKPIQLNNNKVTNEPMFTSLDSNNNDINNVEAKAAAPVATVIPKIEDANINITNTVENENNENNYLNIETNSIKNEIEFDNEDFEDNNIEIKSPVKPSNKDNKKEEIIENDISSDDIIDSLDLEDLELLEDETSIFNEEDNEELTEENDSSIEEIESDDNTEEEIDFSEITEDDIIKSNIQSDSFNESIEFEDEDLDVEPTFSIEDYFGINSTDDSNEESVDKVSTSDNEDNEIDLSKVNTTTVFDKIDSQGTNIDEEIEFDPIEDENENDSENMSSFNKLFESFSQKISILNEKIANLESQKNNIIEDDVVENPVLDIENTLTNIVNNDNSDEDSEEDIDIDVDSELDDLSSLLSDDSSLLDELISNDDISLEDIENLSTDENVELDSDETESENIHNILTDSINSKPSLDSKMQHDLLEELNNDNNEEINPEDATSDFIKIIDSLTKTITQLENTPDIEQSKNSSSLPEELVDESGKAINILINKDDIFSISILNESYDIVVDFDGISVLSENIHISTPKKNFFVKVGNKYIEIHNKGEKFLLQTNFEDIEFANAIKNVSFAKKNNQIELNITDAFKLSSINNKVELSMLNTAIANIKEQTSTENKPVKETNDTTSTENDDTICDNKTLLINEETQKVYLPYTIEDIMKKLNDKSNNYKTVDEVVENEYTLPLSTFKNPIVSRFKEAYRFMRVKEKSSVYAAVDLGLELMFSSNLNPAIIRAAKDLKELNIYLDCLYENEVEKFDCFNVKYKVLPKIH